MRTIVTLANKAKSILWRIGFFSSREKTENYFVRTRSYAWGGVKKIENHIRKKVYFLGLKISSSHKSPSYLEFKKDRKELKDLKDELRSLKQEIYDSSFEKERIFLQSLWR